MSEIIEYHHEQTVEDGIHIPYAFVYSTATQRQAAAGFFSTDIGKLALQQDDFSLWLLKNNEPVQWERVSFDSQHEHDFQDAFTQIKVEGQADVPANTTGILNIIGGNKIVVSTDPQSQSVIISKVEESSTALHANSHVNPLEDLIPSAVANGASGLLTGDDKAKLDTLQEGAEPNQNAFAVINVGGDTINADSPSDTLTLLAGSNITLTPDQVAKSITINAVGSGGGNLTSHAISHYSASGGDIIPIAVPNGNAGLLSGPDKAKLDGIEANASKLPTFVGTGGISINQGTGVLTIGYSNSNIPSHALEHVTGEDQIPLASATTKGLMSQAHWSKLEALDENVAIPSVSYTQNGLMYATDKVKLDKIDAEAKNIQIIGGTGINVVSTNNGRTYEVVNTAPGSSTPGGAVAHASSHLSDGGDAIPLATADRAGLMPSDDKRKLAGVDWGARNVLAGTNIRLESTAGGVIINAETSGGGTAGITGAQNLSPVTPNTGYGVFAQQTGSTLEFKTIQQGQGISLAPNSAGIVVNANIANVTNAFSSGYGLVKGVSSGEASIRGLSAGTGITIESIESDNTYRISSTSSGTSGISAINNLGAGTNIGQVYKETLTGLANLRSLQGGAGIRIENDFSGNYVNISFNAATAGVSLGEANTITNKGTTTGGIGLSTGEKDGSAILIKSLKAGNGIAINGSNPDYLTLSADLSSSHIAADDHTQYVHVSQPRTITAAHKFQGTGSLRLEKTSGNDVPFLIATDGSHNSAAALGVYSLSTAVGAGWSRFGIYCEHSGDAAAIIGLPRGASNGPAVQGRIRPISEGGTTNRSAIAGQFHIDEVSNTAYAVHAGTQGMGGGLHVVSTNFDTTTPAILVDNRGKNDAIAVSQNGTGFGFKGYSIASNSSGVVFANVTSANTNQSSYCVYALQQGVGRGIHCDITNAANGYSAVSGTSNSSSTTSYVASFIHNGNGCGLYAQAGGSSTSSWAIRAQRANGYAAIVADGGNADGMALYVIGKIFATGGLTINGNQVIQGTKSAIVETSQGKRKLYSEESTGVWFSDYGFGQLIQGNAIIAIENLFGETIDLEQPYHVFIQSYASCNGIDVINREKNGFTVKERNEGKSCAKFGYKIVGLRKGFSHLRLEPEENSNA